MPHLRALAWWVVFKRKLALEAALKHLYLRMVRKRSRVAAEESQAPATPRPAKQPRTTPKAKQPKARPEPLPSPDAELTRLHRARFVAWTPTAVVALAASGDGTLLAAARESGEIELWETDTWTCTLVRVVLEKTDTACTSVGGSSRSSCGG